MQNPGRVNALCTIELIQPDGTREPFDASGGRTQVGVALQAALAAAQPRPTQFAKGATIYLPQICDINIQDVQVINLDGLTIVGNGSSLHTVGNYDYQLQFNFCPGLRIEDLRSIGGQNPNAPSNTLRGLGLWIADSPDVHFERVTCNSHWDDGQGSPDEGDGMVFTRCNHATVKNCVVKNNGRYGILFAQSSDSTVDGLEAKHNGRMAVNMAYSGAIHPGTMTMTNIHSVSRLPKFFNNNHKPLGPGVECGNTGAFQTGSVLNLTNCTFRWENPNVDYAKNGGPNGETFLGFSWPVCKLGQVETLNIENVRIRHEPNTGDADLTSLHFFDVQNLSINNTSCSSNVWFNVTDLAAMDSVSLTNSTFNEGRSRLPNQGGAVANTAVATLESIPVRHIHAENCRFGMEPVGGGGFAWLGVVADPAVQHRFISNVFNNTGNTNRAAFKGYDVANIPGQVVGTGNQYLNCQTHDNPDGSLLLHTNGENPHELRYDPALPEAGLQALPAFPFAAVPGAVGMKVINGEFGATLAGWTDERAFWNEATSTWLI